jgi:hypothetical protein
MQINNWVTEDEILAALNVQPPLPSSYAQFLQKLLAETAADKPSDQSLAFLREWVDAANRDVGTPQARFLLNYLLYGPMIPHPSPSQVSWQLPDTISRQESVPIRLALTSAHLRRYVDAWLETGRNRDGSEWPNRRNLFRAPSAFFSVGEYLARLSQN